MVVVEAVEVTVLLLHVKGGDWHCDGVVCVCSAVGGNVCCCLCLVNPWLLLFDFLLST